MVPESFIRYAIRVGSVVVCVLLGLNVLDHLYKHFKRTVQISEDLHKILEILQDRRDKS